VPSCRVLLGAADITGRVPLPSVRVTEAESASALLELEYHPTTAYDPAAPLVLTALTLDVDPEGGTSWERLFSGVIVSAQWDARRKAYQITASSRLQEHFRDMGTPAAVVAAITGAAWSDALFGGPSDDLWEVAQTAMTTVPADVRLNRSGTLVQIPWDTPEGSVELTEADILHSDDAAIVEADADVKTTQVIVELTYTVRRHKVREHTISWTFDNEPSTNTFCSWIMGVDGAYWSPPTYEEAEKSLLSGTAWQVPNGLQAVMIPLDVPDMCFPGMAPLAWAFGLQSQAADGDVLGGQAQINAMHRPLTSAAATGYQALAQDIREVYTLTFTAAGAETYYSGARVTERRTGALQPEAPDTWPPGGSVPTSLPGADSTGDAIEDRDDEIARAAMLQAAYQWGRTRLQAAQRSDSRKFVTILRPDLSPSDVIRITAWDLAAWGKIRRLVHTLSPYRTEGEIALRRGHGGTESAWVVPDRPDTSDPVGYWTALEGSYPAHPTTTALQTYVGSRTTSPDEVTPHAPGWWTNAVGYPGFGDPETPPWDAKVYTPELVVEWPAIEPQATSPMEFAAAIGLEIQTAASSAVDVAA
jgi:hypothetical protein